MVRRRVDARLSPIGAFPRLGRNRLDSGSQRVGTLNGGARARGRFRPLRTVSAVGLVADEGGRSAAQVTPHMLLGGVRRLHAARRPAGLDRVRSNENLGGTVSGDLRVGGLVGYNADGGLRHRGAYRHRPGRLRHSHQFLCLGVARHPRDPAMRVTSRVRNQRARSQSSGIVFRRGERRVRPGASVAARQRGGPPQFPERGTAPPASGHHALMSHRVRPQPCHHVPGWAPTTPRWPPCRSSAVDDEAPRCFGDGGRSRRARHRAANRRARSGTSPRRGTRVAGGHRGDGDRSADRPPGGEAPKRPSAQAALQRLIESRSKLGTEWVTEIMQFLVSCSLLSRLFVQRRVRCESR